MIFGMMISRPFPLLRPPRVRLPLQRSSNPPGMSDPKHWLATEPQRCPRPELMSCCRVPGICFRRFSTSNHIIIQGQKICNGPLHLHGVSKQGESLAGIARLLLRLTTTLRQQHRPMLTRNCLPQVRARPCLAKGFHEGEVPIVASGTDRLLALLSSWVAERRPT
jgi:hypothetical protein